MAQSLPRDVGEKVAWESWAEKLSWVGLGMSGCRGSSLKPCFKRFFVLVSLLGFFEEALMHAFVFSIVGVVSYIFRVS